MKHINCNSNEIILSYHDTIKKLNLPHKKNKKFERVIKNMELDFKNNSKIYQYQLIHVDKYNKIISGIEYLLGIKSIMDTSKKKELKSYIENNLEIKIIQYTDIDITNFEECYSIFERIAPDLIRYIECKINNHEKMLRYFNREYPHINKSKKDCRFQHYKTFNFYKLSEFIIDHKPTFCELLKCNFDEDFDTKIYEIIDKIINYDKLLYSRVIKIKNDEKQSQYEKLKNYSRIFHHEFGDKIFDTIDKCIKVRFVINLDYDRNYKSWLSHIL